MDAIFKYNGWAFQTAFLQRDTDNAITINPDDNTEQRFVLAGSGFDAQLSYLFLNNLEVAGRYSYSTPKNQIQNFLLESEQLSLGVTKYIWEHALKLQGEVTYEYGTIGLNPVQNSWYFRFQVEIGI